MMISMGDPALQRAVDSIERIRAAEASQLRRVALCQNPQAVEAATRLANSEGFKNDERKTSLLWSRARRELGADFDFAWANQHAFALRCAVDLVRRPDGRFDTLSRLGVTLVPISYIEPNLYRSNSACPVMMECPLFDNRGSCREWLECRDRATEAREFLPFLFERGLRWSVDFQRRMDRFIQGESAGEPIFLRALESLELSETLPSTPLFKTPPRL